MDGLKKVVFIVNPISGIGKKGRIPELIDDYLDHSQYSFQIEYTEYRKHASEITAKYVKTGSVDIIAVVGGDGSVNEVARELIYSKIALAIIPAGSGNGFARHFNIPMNLKKAIQVLNSGTIKRFDCGKINDSYFFATCGFGFDAKVTHEFDRLKKRGFFGYVKAILNCYQKSENELVRIVMDGLEFQVSGFILTIANTSQYGNNFYISPNSKADDGKLELVVVEKPKLFQIPIFLWKSFNRKVDSYSGFKELNFLKATVEINTNLGHVDGDPILLKEQNSIELVPLSLSLIC